MKSTLIILLLLFSPILKVYSQKIQIFCATPTNRYYIYQINGVLYSPNLKGEIFILSKKDVIKGRRYFKNYRRVNIFLRQIFSFTETPDKIVKGVNKLPYNGSFKKVDTLIYTNITLKYPMEINGDFNYVPKTKYTIVDSFRLVEQCIHYDKKHFEFFTK